MRHIFAANQNMRARLNGVQLPPFVLATSRPGPRWPINCSARPGIRPLPVHQCHRTGAGRRSVFTRARGWKQREKRRSAVVPVLVGGTLLVYSLYPADEFDQLKAKDGTRRRRKGGSPGSDLTGDAGEGESPQGAWSAFAKRFEGLTNVADFGTFSVVDYILPEWSRLVPGYLRKLQRELSMAPGSLADEIWTEAQDALIHPEIRYSAKVRVSEELCDEEKGFLERRRKIATVALTRYLGLQESDVNPDDVPVIGICGSGGGLRALVAGAGSLTAAADDGLFDCVTYTAGVSGSCWLQSLYFSSITGCQLDRLVDHLRNRLNVHIAFPPAAFSSLVSAPTNKSLLSGLVEKLKADPKADFGLVDVYGILLAGRLLVPKGELGVNERDFKLSNQREYIQYGQNPMPIYTAVRHEIPDVDIDSRKDAPSASEEEKAVAKNEAWFQWFEITPYEFFCEEFAAGIPTWAMGRRFRDGVDVPLENGIHLPETRMPLLLGMFGSAFCATLSHYYREVQPLILGLTGFAAIDEMITGRNEDLSKVHPIDPTSLPNPVYGMEGKLPKTTPGSVLKSEYIQLMDAGMSNNLPIYPFLRPGRDVEIIIAFDASAEIQTYNWLSVADGYARQRGIKGWPVGIGWPKGSDSAGKTAQALEEAEAASTAEAEQKLTDAKVEETVRRLGESPQAEGSAANGAVSKDGGDKGSQEKYQPSNEEAGGLGYCTVWVGTTQERSSEPPPPMKTVGDEGSWQLMEPDAGITVVYLPFLANDKVPGVDPGSSDYMSTWNFIYTPDQIDSVVALAKANYSEGQEQIKATVRAVYERKKKAREEREAKAKREHHRRLVRLGIVGRLGEGDHFS